MAKANNSYQQPSLEQATTSDKVAAWRHALAQLRAAYEDPDRSDESLAPFEKAVTATTHQIWSQGAKTWGDVALLAEIARHWNWDPDDPGLAREYFDLLERNETGDHTHMDDQAMAQLVRAALTLPGCDMALRVIGLEAMLCDGEARIQELEVENATLRGALKTLQDRNAP